MSLERLGVGIYKTACSADTEHFGELVAPCLEDGDVLILTGGLGVGKTHFTKGVSRGLGDGHMVTSPTFALMAVHDQGRIPLFHFDMYRLGSSDELFDIGWEDYLARGGVCAVEWSENVREALPPDAVTVTIARCPENDSWRSITIEGGEPL